MQLMLQTEDDEAGWPGQAGYAAALPHLAGTEKTPGWHHEPTDSLHTSTPPSSGRTTENPGYPGSTKCSSAEALFRRASQPRVRHF